MGVRPHFPVPDTRCTPMHAPCFPMHRPCFPMHASVHICGHRGAPRCTRRASRCTGRASRCMPVFTFVDTPVHPDARVVLPDAPAVLPDACQCAQLWTPRCIPMHAPCIPVYTACITTVRAVHPDMRGG